MKITHQCQQYYSSLISSSSFDKMDLAHLKVNRAVASPVTLIMIYKKLFPFVYRQVLVNDHHKSSFLYMSLAISWTRMMLFLFWTTSLMWEHYTASCSGECCY
jgi:hypothetical protein